MFFKGETGKKVIDWNTWRKIILCFWNFPLLFSSLSLQKCRDAPCVWVARVKKLLMNTCMPHSNYFITVLSSVTLAKFYRRINIPRTCTKSHLTCPVVYRGHFMPKSQHSYHISALEVTWLFLWKQYTDQRDYLVTLGVVSRFQAFFLRYTFWSKIETNNNLEKFS